MLRALDLALLRLLRTRWHAPALEVALTRLTRIGEHGLGWCALAAAGASLDGRRRPTWLHGLRAVPSAYAVNQLVKAAVRRRRPRLAGLPPLVRTRSELSYPSAHASTSFAAAGALSPVLPVVPLYAAATLMALTRPYLGVHHPSDVLAGAALGAAVARLAP
ncbi:MAG: phosphatase PAP2 family protein [Nocardioidaceae bacterium]